MPLALGLAGLLAAAATLGCGAPARETYEVRGLVEAVDPSGAQLKVAHEEIPGFMPAMTMNFDVAPASLLEGIEPGMRVRFTLERNATRLRITSIEVLGRDETAGASGGFGGLAEREQAPEFRLIDQDGRAMALSDLREKAVLLDFIFTRCNGPCPILTSSHVTLQRRLPAEIAARTHFVSITVDPEHDTPADLRAYASARGADLRAWSFLTGEPETVRSTIGRYRLAAARQPDGQIDHMVATFLVDPEGRIAKRYLGLEHGAEEILEDLRAVLR
jgi:protein SCO1/2